MNTFYIFFMVSAACLQVNEAGRLSMSAGRLSMSASAKSMMRLRKMWKAEQVDSARSMAEIKAGMTTEKALAIVPKVNGATASLQSFIQETLGQHHLRKRHRHIHEHHASPAGAKGNSGSDYVGGTNVALARINDMMLETIEKHDFQDIRCSDYNESQVIILVEIQQDRKILETLGELAGVSKHDAYAQKTKYQDMSDKIKIQLAKWLSQCQRESVELQSQYDVATGDMTVMLKVLDMVNCESPVVMMQTGQTMHPQTRSIGHSAAMVKCTNTKTGEIYEKLSILDEAMLRELAKIKHPKVVNLLNSVLHRRPEEVMNATTIPDPSMAEEKCSLENSTKCPELRERFLNIQGGIEDTIMQIAHFISNQQLRCKHAEEMMTAEMSLYIQSVDRYTVIEKRAIATIGEYLVQDRAKTLQYIQTANELSQEMHGCDSTLKELLSEHCALGKIRGELLKMDALPNNVIDCEVTAWTPMECSATCGGGKRFLDRTISVPTDGGHHCPPLRIEQNCNTERCPADCEVADWSGWGPCSAFCNGGIEERLRKIMVHNTPGGDACPQTSDAQQCNLDNCDANCELHDWSAWSPTCNKVCGGGRLTRFKHLKTTEKGTGTCPAFHDPKRFHSKPCNTQPCVHDVTKKMMCDAKYDVMLVLDGSGSMGQENFDGLKAAARNITASMGADVMVGALQFGGPEYGRTENPAWTNGTRNWWLCGGYDWAEKAYGGHGVAPNDLCGMKWETALNFDKAKVDTDIDLAQWLKASYTLTHMALNIASKELRFGRSDAQSIVIVLTDAVPAMIERTQRAAVDLMKSARLMWIPVGVPTGAATGFHSMASEPVDDNVIDIKDIKTLNNQATLEKIITNFCPVIHYETIIATTTTTTLMTTTTTARRRRR